MSGVRGQGSVVSCQLSGVSCQDFFEGDFRALKESDAWRELRTVTDRQGSMIMVDGQQYINFGSNDYLGLSQHPILIEAAIKATERWGVGAQASRLVTGNYGLVEELESVTAEFKGTASSLVFPTGYQANVGLLTALFQKGDVIILDKLCHASLVDGTKLSGATVRVYPHGDLEYLQKLLDQTQDVRRRAVVTESIFSMDGDLAALDEIALLLSAECGARNAEQKLKNEELPSTRHPAPGTFLIVDDAHATGVLGPKGEGAKAHFNLPDSEHFETVWTGTYSKALGSQGGYVCGSRALRAYLINHARAFIYSTGLAPAAAGAALAAVQLLQRDESFVEGLRTNIQYFSQRLFELKVRPSVLSHSRAELLVPTANILSPIFPIILGANAAVLAKQETLKQKDFWVPAMRYPTVKQGSERLRVSLRADHSQPMVNNLCRALLG